MHLLDSTKSHSNVALKYKPPANCWLWRDACMRNKQGCEGLFQITVVCFLGRMCNSLLLVLCVVVMPSYEKLN